jgi:hypothetical protein
MLESGEAKVNDLFNLIKQDAFNSQSQSEIVNVVVASTVKTYATFLA